MADVRPCVLDPAALDKAVEPLTWFLNPRDLHQLAANFTSTYRSLAQSSPEHFLVTPVTSLPTGLESGKHLAIDIGGTNLRVGLLELLGDIPLQQIADAEDVSNAKIRKHHDRSWPIEDHLKMDQSDDLFAWIGACIAEVLTEVMEMANDENILGEVLPIGITFSFPLMQTSMNEGVLMGMGKGFAIKPGSSLGDLVLAGYARHCAVVNGNGVNHEHHDTKRRAPQLPRLRIAAITNDTVATFAALAYATMTTTNSKTTMGLIVGTGCNATIPMKLKYIGDAKRKAAVLPEDFDESWQKIVINTEWTIKGVDVPMRELGVITSWDDDLSQNNEVPGFQPFEYMTAGRYLGEIVRLAFVDTITKASEAADVLPAALMAKHSISTGFLATVIAVSEPENLAVTLQKTFPSTDDNFIWDISKAQFLTRLAAAVSARAAALIAAAVIGLLGCVEELRLDGFDGDRFTREGNPKPGEPRCDMVVAFTGKTIAGYPSYRSTCQLWLDELLRNGSEHNAGKRVVLKAATDGGIIGAAVLAGMMTSA